jgi:RND family efflux transporter MFP subunit
MSRAWFLAGLAALAGCHRAPSQSAPPPPVVYVAQVMPEDVKLYEEVVGQTTGANNVEIRARVEGYIEKRHFVEGTLVKKGDLLFTIDPKPQRVAVTQAQANLAKTEADRVKAEADLKRYEPLAERRAVSRQELDNARSTLRAAEAQVKAQRAALETSRLSLGYTQVRAPLDGLVGKSEVSLGSLVGHGDATRLTTISQVDPMWVDFSITEQAWLATFREGQRMARAKQKPEDPHFQLILSDGTEFPEKGKLVSGDRSVDTRTGTLKFTAAFANPSRMLRPGQFVRVKFVSDSVRGALLVLQRAVMDVQGSTSLAVVGAGDVVELRPVKLGARTGSRWIVKEGLKAGERVVIEGLQKVTHGAKVVQKPMPAASESAAATP